MVQTIPICNNEAFPVWKVSILFAEMFLLEGAD